jgi:glutathione S-transferase
MTQEIQFADIKIPYISLAEARQRSGLRLVLGAYAVPGPWREACKGLFYVKKIPYAAVVTASAGRSDLEFGADGADRELLEWTGQSSAPVAIWNDERPCVTWVDQINLAERLQPDPPLLPAGVEDRALMFGLCQELAGEHGFAWTKRLAIIYRTLAALPIDDPGRGFWQHIGNKYRYTEEAGAAAPARMARTVRALARQLEQQYDAGRTYFVGGRLSALDIYWATFATMLDPLPPDLCPMATAFRGSYSNPDPEVQDALSSLLLQHRDFIYRSYLELPVVF